MIPLVRIEVVLGTRRERLDPDALAHALGLDARRVLHVLGRLAFRALPQEEGDVRGRCSSPDRERNDDEQFRPVPFGEDGGPGEETTDVDRDPERFADYLADLFRDDKSLAFYKLVCRTIPREVVRDALTRALDVPRRDVRRSRAAIFTALILPRLRAARRATPPLP